MSNVMNPTFEQFVKDCVSEIIRGISELKKVTEEAIDLTYEDSIFLTLIAKALFWLTYVYDLAIILRNVIFNY